jgi:hypothetical protein
MKKTSGQKLYEKFCSEFGHASDWEKQPLSNQKHWENIAKGPIAADDPNNPPNEPPTSGN